MARQDTDGEDRGLLPRSTPSAEGIDARNVMALLDAFEKRSVECHSIVIVRHGRVVADGWWAPYSAERPHLLYSVTKSFTSIAVGLAIADGVLQLEDRVVDVLRDHVPSDASEQARQLTVEHLLMMTTGHRTDTLSAAWDLEPTDLVKGFLRVPADDAVGTSHAYNNPTSFVLARMVERVTGVHVPDLLEQRLFGPMGMRGAEWDHVASGRTFGFHGLHLTTEGLAAFGELLLRHGRWRGRQLVPRGWVELATRRHVPTVQSEDGWRTADWLEGYGYHFWMSRHGYRADGAFGQFCVIVPEQDLVIAMTAAATDLRAPLELFWHHLLPGLGHRGSRDDDVGLAAQLRRLSMAPVTGAREPGRRAAAPVDVTSDAPAVPHGGTVEVDPDAEGWQVTVETGGLRVRIAVGYETWRESAPLGRPVVAMGAWERGSFVADLYVITGPHRARLVVRGERAVLDWNVVPLTDPDLLLHLREPLVTRPDVA
jgi:CubicO group peptidase (beta-lactamase class C family)